MANGANAVAKWAVIRANPRALAVNPPRTTWPTVTTPTDNEGEYNSFNLHLPSIIARNVIFPVFFRSLYWIGENLTGPQLMKLISIMGQGRFFFFLATIRATKDLIHSAGSTVNQY
jgi:hypothetical protein